MVDADPGYTLTATDAAAFTTLLQAQNWVGPSRSPGRDQLLAFYAAVDSFSYDAYRTITNPTLQGWVGLLYPPMINTKTCYGISAAGMYALYAYAAFVQASFTQTDYEPDNTEIVDFWIANGGQDADFGSQGFPNAVPYGWFGFAGVGMWRPPGQPATFYQALVADVLTLNAALAQAKAASGTVELFSEYSGHCDSPAAVVQFEHTRFDPAHWTDVSAFLTNIGNSALWQQQLDAVKSLLKPDTLGGGDYFFLLHLLIGLTAGDPPSVELASQIASAPADSTEYPNDTFVNQLVYLTLLYLADPMGSFAWTTTQLEAELTGLAGAISGTDPGSVAVQTSLSRHLRVLQVDTAYPLQDPYCPSIGFPQRQSDTLFALDKARSRLSTTTS
jgi:hypothetical protein